MVLYKIGGGRIWLNPPYSKPLIWQFVEKLAEHGNGIALLFNRCDSNKFQDIIFTKATGMMFSKDYKEGFDTGIKQCIEILDRNCHSKEINNDETVQN